MPKNANTDNKPAAPEQGSSRKMPLKTVMILLGALLLEAAVISAVFILAGGPSGVRAEGPGEDTQVERTRPVELLVVEDRFPNNRRGTTYLYDTRVHIVVQAQHEVELTEKIESMQAQIRGEIRVLISQAEPSQLSEPTLATLRRQIHAVLDHRLGPDEEGNSRIESIEIDKFIQIRAVL